MDVTIVAGMYQWADTQRTAPGRGIEAPRAVQPSLHLFCRMAFIGLPCPIKMAGMDFASAVAITFFLPGPDYQFLPEVLVITQSANACMNFAANSRVVSLARLPFSSKRFAAFPM